MNKQKQKPNFKLLDEFEVELTEFFNINSFKLIPGNFSCFDVDINTENFPNNITEITKKTKAFIYALEDNTSAEDIKRFIYGMSGYLPGAYGLAQVLDQKRTNLPTDTNILAFAVERDLFCKDEVYQVPYLFITPNVKLWHVSLTTLHGLFHKESSILFFKD